MALLSPATSEMRPTAIEEICRPRKIRYTHRAFQDTLYALILTGKASMNSSTLRREMALLLDYLHIKFRMTTVGTTGGIGSKVGWKCGGRGWTMRYIFDCIQKKKIGKTNILDVGLDSVYLAGVDPEIFAERITRPGITFDEFEQESIDAFTFNPYWESAYCLYGYISVNRIVRVLELDTEATPPGALARLNEFITNRNTFDKKVAQVRTGK